MRCRPYDSDNDNDNTTTKTRTTNGGNGARQLHKSTTFSVLKRLAIHSWLWPLLPSPSTIRILRLSLGSRIFDFAEQSNPLGFPVCVCVSLVSGPTLVADSISKARTAGKGQSIRVLVVKSKSRLGCQSVEAKW